MVSDLEARIRNVTAVIGPTNTGKTHLAIERMLGHKSGMIGLPLRLLAREVYDKICARVGADQVALITGEEKIKPERARYWVATVEAMPRDVDVDFLAIDEIQLAADLERGHVFTDRLLHARGQSETLLLGAQTMRDCIADLIPGANFISRPRLSKLTYSGQKKITRLPARSAIVAFSAQEVYEIAELIRRQRGGAAVVLGALSPRTRNAQVELYQSGDVEHLVATDAIGMGLNLDVDHVAFSSLRKFDGSQHRPLTPSEIGQIAGRAGRHMNDGTFGVTGRADPLDPEIVERLESHTFDPVKVLQWRNRSLNFASLDALSRSLRELPDEPRLARARAADDVLALDAAMRDSDVMSLATGQPAVVRLWEACQIPDYRKISGQSHAELVASIFKFIADGNGKIPEDWFARQVALADRVDGDIDTIANRIAHIRTWTFVANREEWLQDAAHWQDRTREIEDKLSDALHECLTQRFVDRRTSALMKGMRNKDELNAEIGEDGSISVEDHYVGRLNGLQFTLDATSTDVHGRATRQAASQVVARELGMRVRRIVAAQDNAFSLNQHGDVLWRGELVGKLEASDDPLAPTVTTIADEEVPAAERDRVTEKLITWLKAHIAEKLKPLVDMAAHQDLQGLARGVAFQLKENLGALKRETVAKDISALDQSARAELRRFGLRFGAFNIYFPALLKPAPAELAAVLWLVKSGNTGKGGLADTATLPRAGLTSVVAEPATPEEMYRVNGFHLCGPRAVRLDILERLADQIRPLLAWRGNPDEDTSAPKGSTGDGAFRTTDDMMSILGCSASELSEVLNVLGFRVERRPVQPAAESAKRASANYVPAPAVPASYIAASVEPSETPSAQQPADGAQQTKESDAGSEEQFEEIWRPRRNTREGGRQYARGRRHAGGDKSRAHKPGATADAGQAAPPNTGPANKGRQGRDADSNRKHHRGKKNEQNRRPAVTSAAPPKKKKTADPDSPFAALAALKSSMAKEESENKT